MATITAAHQKAIADLYVALFNRAPDADGLGFWAQALADGASLDTIARSFVTHPEARTVFPESQTAEQFVTAYYSNVLGRTVDANGLEFWTTLLRASGGVESAAARALVVAQIVEIVNTPLPVKPADISDEAYVLTFADRNAFKNKSEVAIYYAVEYQGNDLSLAKQVLSVVGPTVDTIDVAKELLNPPTGTPAPTPIPDPVPPTTAQDYVGSTGTDVFLGSPEDDTFSFVIDNTTPSNTTLQAADKVIAGEGNDTLKITTRGTVNASDFTAPTITGIETVVLTVEDGVAFYTPPAGVTKLVFDGGAGLVSSNGVAATTQIVMTGGTSVRVEGSFVDAATSATVELSGANGASLLMDAAGLATATVTSKGVANSLDNFRLKATTLNIVADTALSMNGPVIGKGGTINISGNAAVSLGILGSTTVASVDASANTGGVKAEISKLNQAIVFKGSQGDDVVTTGIGEVTGSVDAGDGTADRLIVDGAWALSTSALRGKYVNFEILEVRDRVTVDLDGLVGITSIEIADVTGSTGVTNLSAAQAASVKILSANSTGPVTIGMQNTSGTDDTVKAALSTVNDNGAQNIDLAGLTLAGIEKLELTGNTNILLDAGLVTLTTANATSLDSIIVKNTGGASVTVAAGHTATNLAIDASGSVGIVTLNASAYNTATGVTLKAGGNTSMLTGSAKADTLYGGKTVSTFTTMTGGDGADTFVFSIADTDTAHGRITAVITDFQTGVDKIHLTVAAPTNGGSYFEAGAPAASMAALLEAADAALNGTVKVYVGEFDGDGYVVADANGVGYTEVIKLTGVGLSGIAFTDFVTPTPP